MLEQAMNGRGETATLDREGRRYWLGTDADDESATLGELMTVPKLIGQFYTVSPWAGVQCNVEFHRRVLSVAASCFGRERPTVEPADEVERAAFSAVWRHARRMRDNDEVLGTGLPFFAEAVGAIGFSDVVFRENGAVTMREWKTGDLMLTAKCRFNAPFSHLVADPVTICSLQCSANLVLADLGGYFGFAKFTMPKMMWLHADGDGLKVDEVPCRDLRREASLMLMSKRYTPWWRDWQGRCPF